MKLYKALSNGAPSGTALNIQELRRLYPNVSFPTEPSREDLIAFNYCIFELTTPPTASTGNKVVEDTPEELEPGRWQQTWKEVELTTEELEQQATKLKINLKNHAEFKVLLLEEGNISYDLEGQTVPISTRKQDRLQYDSAYLRIRDNTRVSGSTFKFGDNIARAVTNVTMLEIIYAVNNYLQNILNIQSTVESGIEDNSITTEQQIDDLFNGISIDTITPPPGVTTIFCSGKVTFDEHGSSSVPVGSRIAGACQLDTGKYLVFLSEAMADTNYMVLVYCSGQIRAYVAEEDQATDSFIVSVEEALTGNPVDVTSFNLEVKCIV